MPKDKYTALWVSHSSMSDFLSCPRAYYLKNIYKDPKTGNKVQIVSAALSLGSAVHEVVEGLSELKTEDRFKDSLLQKYESAWKKFTGKRGGFADASTEENYKEQGREMIRRIIANPGPLKNLSVKVKEDLPQFWLSEEENIILCGKIDWLEYLPESNSVHIIDFKTSKKEEKEDSLQLPIYYLLVNNVQKRKVAKASYWYLRFDNDLTPKSLPNLEEAYQAVIDVAKKMKLAKKLGAFKCPKGEDGCFHCKPFEAILRGEGEFVGLGEHKKDLYLVGKNQDSKIEDDSVIL